MGRAQASWAYALAAHARGELPARLREYLRKTSEMPELATRLFDGQLCVTERLLYGGMPYGEVIEFADSLAAEAVRLGAKRGEAFALTLRGEARLLSGDLTRPSRICSRRAPAPGDRRRRRRRRCPAEQSDGAASQG